MGRIMMEIPSGVESGLCHGRVVASHGGSHERSWVASHLVCIPCFLNDAPLHRGVSSQQNTFMGPCVLAWGAIRSARVNFLKNEHRTLRR